MKTKRSIEKATEFINNKLEKNPKIALILGSGLGQLSKDIKKQINIRYGDIPDFPISTAPGHAGHLTIGELEGKQVIVMNGRFHLYEGYDLESIAFPIRILKKLGVKILILTNAAGGINRTFNPGDLMVITDHLNMTGWNPLIGPNDESLGPRFPDMGKLYNPDLINHLNNIASSLNIPLKQGIYAWMTGPSFETPAEIDMIRIMHGDAVGMSTVPEAITAHHCGIKVVGISCISNMAAGVLDQSITEEEVFEIAKHVYSDFSALIRRFLKELFPKKTGEY